ncbi:response regulator [Paraburkholderia sp. UCT31]|uniref:hybrid sensor histidine kinase/response regulator n=1 Tax=Paraburkholderia sp. UCT31 TaxID=2615209 RepID=UPI0016563441|nr:ATP-binding protein [Paraburkholderia sp. UCT31]MBC8738580.1 response regulator [Paraburkholderia sp. UCT31]
MALASWSRKKLSVLYVSAAVGLTGALIPLAHHLLSSDEALVARRFNNEELYWEPAQLQLAAERFCKGVEELELHRTNVADLNARLDALNDALGHVRDSVRGGRALSRVPQAEETVVNVSTFIAASRTTLNTRPNDFGTLQAAVHGMVSAVGELRANARAAATEVRRVRNMESQQNHRRFLALLCSGWVTLVTAFGFLLFSLKAKDEAVMQRQKAIEDAARAKDARNTFLGKISHEIISPLQSFVTNVQLLEERCASDPAATKVVKRLKTSVALLRAQAGDLLEVTELESRRLSLSREVVDIAALLAESLEVHEASTDLKNLSLSFSHGNIGLIVADGRRICQILTNLVTNAINNTDRGAVTVHASLRAQASMGQLVMRVRDTGSGIPPDIQQHLFDPFVRANKSRGTGLGMAIVKGLVDQMRGDITYTTSELGTEFVVTIPVGIPEAGVSVPERPARPVAPPPAAPIASPGEASLNAPLGSVKLLYAEDDLSIQETLGDLLLSYGYAVDTASTVKQAKECLLNHPYDCIILDMQLPDGTGLDAARFCQKTQNFATPVIAVTAYHDLLSQPGTEIFRAALKKPVSVQDLQDALEKCIRASREELDQ